MWGGGQHSAASFPDESIVPCLLLDDVEEEEFSQIATSVLTRRSDEMQDGRCYRRRFQAASKSIYPLGDCRIEKQKDATLYS